jgi:hypothetical protein
MNINLHIERLVLNGVDTAPGQRDLLRAAVEAELTRLLMEGGLAPQLTGGGAVRGIVSPALNLSRTSTATELGRQIAGSVYAGVWK